MNKRLLILLMFFVVVFMSGCVNKAALEESIKASISESAESSSLAEQNSQEEALASADHEAIKILTAGYDVFNIGETAKFGDISITVDSAKYVTPIQKINGKQSDYTIEIQFTISNNGPINYKPLGDLSAIAGPEYAEQNATPMSDEERAQYDAGVNQGETKSFRIWYAYNADYPEVTILKWDPYSSVLGPTGTQIYVNINDVLREQWLEEGA